MPDKDLKNLKILVTTPEDVKTPLRVLILVNLPITPILVRTPARAFWKIPPRASKALASKVNLSNIPILP